MITTVCLKSSPPPPLGTHWISARVPRVFLEHRPNTKTKRKKMRNFLSHGDSFPPLCPRVSCVPSFIQGRAQILHYRRDKKNRTGNCKFCRALPHHDNPCIITLKNGAARQAGATEATTKFRKYELMKFKFPTPPACTRYPLTLGI